MNSIRRGFIAAASVALFVHSFTAPHARALTLTPGTILGADTDTNTLVKYSQAGAILETLGLTNANNLGNIDGLTIIGSNVYLCGTNSTVAQVNLTTGVVSNFFSITAGGVEALGDLNGNIMAGLYSSNRIDIYTTAGAFLNSITPAVSSGMTGLDSDGTRIFMAGYNTGFVYTLDLSGNVLSSFNVNAGTQSISGLGYDAGSNTLWVSTGFNQDDIRHFSLSGTFLGSFPAGYGWINALDVVPSVPEPASLVLGPLSFSWMMGARRQRRQIAGN